MGILLPAPERRRSTRLATTSSELDDYAWHTGNAAGNDPPVGAKKPNPWGLYDVHGYLWEWTSAPAGVGVKGRRPRRKLEGQGRRADQQLAPRSRASTCAMTPLVSAACYLLPRSGSSASGAGGFHAHRPRRRSFPPAASSSMLWGEGEFTEGPALAPDGSILFSDIGTTIYRFDPKIRSRPAMFREPSGRSQRPEVQPARGA